MTLSLCFVGCGKWARNLLEGTPDLPDDFRLFFASSDPRKAREFCETFGGEDFFDSYEAAARDPRVEALYFATPHDAHLDNAKLAAREHKHMLVEKPIARTAAEAEAMIRVTREAGVKLMVAENYRFLNTVNMCKRLISDGAIGELRLIEAHMVHMAQDITGWRTDRGLRGGGVVIDAGIHYVDLMVNIGGPPTTVYAAIPPSTLDQLEGEDGAVMTAKFEGGAVGLINLYAGASITESQEMTHVTGTAGQLRFRPYGTEVVLDTLEGTRTIEVGDSERGVKAMFREFKESVLQNREPLMTGEEGLKDLSVVLAAYRSAEEGLEVAINATG